MSKGLSPTQRTLAALRDRGMICSIVERHVSKIGKFGKKFDAFGFIDLIALDPERHKIVGVQCCGSGGEFAKHHRKMVVECHEEMIAWINCGGIVELWGWRKVKLHRNGKKMIWQPRVGVYDSVELVQRNAGKLEESAHVAPEKR